MFLGTRNSFLPIDSKHCARCKAVRYRWNASRREDDDRTPRFQQRCFRSCVHRYYPNRRSIHNLQNTSRSARLLFKLHVQSQRRWRNIRSVSRYHHRNQVDFDIPQLQRFHGPRSNFN
eukprot:PhF_6_TR29125/c1_g1_i1/m.42513